MISGIAQNIANLFLLHNTGEISLLINPQLFAILVWPGGIYHKSPPSPLHDGANRSDSPLRPVIRIQVGKCPTHSKNTVSPNSLNCNYYHFCSICSGFQKYYYLGSILYLSSFNNYPFKADFTLNDSAFLAFSMYLTSAYFVLFPYNLFLHHAHFLFHLGLFFSWLLLRTHRRNDFLHPISIL